MSVFITTSTVLVGAGLIRGVVSAFGNIATKSKLLSNEATITRSVNDTNALQWQQRFRSFDSSNVNR